MNNNQIIRTLLPGQKVQLTLVDGRIFKGEVVGNGMQQWINFVDGNGAPFTVRRALLHRCLGTLEVVE